MIECTVWVAYNGDEQCFASHESAQEAMDGLLDAFGHGEGARVVELKLSLPDVKPLEVEATVPDHVGRVSVTVR